MKLSTCASHSIWGRMSILVQHSLRLAWLLTLLVHAGKVELSRKGIAQLRADFLQIAAVNLLSPVPAEHGAEHMPGMRSADAMPMIAGKVDAWAPRRSLQKAAVKLLSIPGQVVQA